MTDKVAAFEPCQIDLDYFDGRKYTFRLTVVGIAEIQKHCGAGGVPVGIGVIYARLCHGGYFLEDLIEVIRQGLIGGGVASPEARRMIERYEPGTREGPALELWHELAYQVIGACVHGYIDPDEPSDPDEKKTDLTPAHRST